MTFYVSNLKVFGADILTNVPHRAQMAYVIKNTLMHRSISQKDFARMVGSSEKHVSQVLTGAVDGSAELLDAFARTLGLEWVIAAREIRPHPEEFGHRRDRWHG